MEERAPAERSKVKIPMWYPGILTFNHLLNQRIKKIYKTKLNLLQVLQVYLRGTRWRSWLRHCAISRKVAGSIPDGVIGIFH